MEPYPSLPHLACRVVARRKERRGRMLSLYLPLWPSSNTVSCSQTPKTTRWGPDGRFQFLQTHTSSVRQNTQYHHLFLLLFFKYLGLHMCKALNRYTFTTCMLRKQNYFVTLVLIKFLFFPSYFLDACTFLPALCGFLFCFSSFPVSLSLHVKPLFRLHIGSFFI